MHKKMEIAARKVDIHKLEPRFNWNSQERVKQF